MGLLTACSIYWTTGSPPGQCQGKPRSRTHLWPTLLQDGAIAPGPETDPDEKIDDLGIEDAVIRELARSLQPQRS